MSSPKRSLPKALRNHIYERDDYTCQSCGYVIPPHSDAEYASNYAPTIKRTNKQGKEKWCVLQIDHIHPKKHGGTDLPHNLQAMCSWCNTVKLAHTGEVDWDVRFKVAGELIETGPPSLRVARLVIEAMVGRRLYVKGATRQVANDLGGFL